MRNQRDNELSALNPNRIRNSYVFNQECSRNALANVIVMHKYPISIVDHVGFRRIFFMLFDHYLMWFPERK